MPAVNDNQDNVEVFIQKGCKPNDIARDMLSDKDIEHCVVVLKRKDDSYQLGESGLSITDMLVMRELLTIRINELM